MSSPGAIPQAEEGEEGRRTLELALDKVAVLRMFGKLGQRTQEEEQKEHRQNVVEMKRGK